MANIGTSTVAYATQQPTGQLVFVASDGLACVLWCDGTNQLFSYAVPPYTSWTPATLVTGTYMALGGEFAAGSDNINTVTGGTGGVRPTYRLLTRIGSTWTVGSGYQISTTAAGTLAVGNVMNYCGQDPQGRHWIVCGGASTYLTSRALYSPANNPASASWTSSISTTQTSDVNLPAGDQIGNYLLKTYWNGTAIQYHRLDTSVATLGAWSTAATIPNLAGSPNASSRMTLRAISTTQGLLVYSTGSGIYAQTYTAGTDTWSSAVQLSTNANDRHPAIATDSVGNAWVFWCSYVGTNSYALVYKEWNGATWDSSPTTLASSGTNITNPHAGWGNNALGVVYTAGTGSPYTLGWAVVPTLLNQVRTAAATAALLQTVTAHPSYASVIAGNTPLAWWRMNESSGTAASDSSGNGKTATLTGVTAYSATGAIVNESDHALSFSESGGLAFPASLNIHTMSTLGVEFWIDLGDGWEYAGFDTDGSTTTLYHNGGISVPDASAPLAVEQGFAWAGADQAGSLDEIAVYSRLTASVALADYQAGTVPFFAVPCSASLSVPLGSRTIPCTGALLATMPVRTMTSNAAFLIMSRRTVLLSVSLLLEKSRSITTCTASLLFTQNRSVGTTASLFNQAMARTSGATVALFNQVIPRSIGTNASLMNQGLTRGIGANASFSITRVIPCAASLAVVVGRSIGATTSLSFEKSRTSGASVAFLVEKTRNSGSSAALLKEAGRTVGLTVTLSITRIIGVSASLSITRVIPASGALSSAATLRMVTSTAALGITHVRTFGLGAALFVEKTRPALGTSTALSLPGSRTTPMTASLFITRVIPSSVILGNVNAIRTLPVTSPFIAEKTRTTPASTPTLWQAARSMSVSLALMQIQSRITTGTLALALTSGRTSGATVALSLLGTKTRTIGIDAVLSGGSRSLTSLASIAETKGRTFTTTGDLAGVFTRGIAALLSVSIAQGRITFCQVSLSWEKSRSLTGTACLSATFTRSLVGTVSLQAGKERVIGTSASVARNERVIGSQVALSKTSVRTFSTAGLLGTARATTIPVEAALVTRGQRSIPTGVIFLCITPNALVEVKSGRTVVTVRGGMSDG